MALPRGISGPELLGLVTRTFRPHVWLYAVVMLAAGLLALLSAAGWLFWPLMAWTILFLAHFLLFKSLNVSGDWVDERTERTIMKAQDISHIESIRESYEKSLSRRKESAGDAAAEQDESARTES